MSLFDPTASFWIPLIIACVFWAAVLAAPQRETVFVLGGISFSLVILSLAGAAGWSWLLRDGLGPDAIPSRGGSAAARFLEGFAPPLLIGVATAAGILAVCRRRLRALA